MSEAVQVALIAAVPSTLVAIATLVSSMRHRKRDKADHIKVGEQVEEIHSMLNGRAR